MDAEKSNVSAYVCVLVCVCAEVDNNVGEIKHIE